MLGSGISGLTAHYGGDANFKPSVSPSETLTVQKSTPDVSVTLSQSTVTYGHEQTVTATVTATAPGHSRRSSVPGWRSDRRTGLRRHRPSA